MKPSSNNTPTKATTLQDQIVEEKTGVTFKDKSLLHLALIHRSFLNENKGEPESNERLEFLGDAVLELISSEHLFYKFPNQDEGHLTALRSQLVNTITLSKVATELGLGEALYLSRGEEKSGGRTNTGLLANTVEALIGAMFLDQGLEGARVFIENHILNRIPDITKKSLKDAKSLLQEYVQANGHSSPVYKVVEESGPDHAKEFIVEVMVGNMSYATGRGNSKQQAAQDAAEKALLNWTKEE